MQLLKFNIIKLTICLTLGISIGYFTYISIKTVLLSTAFLLFTLLVIYLKARSQFLKSTWFGILAFLLTITVGILTTTLHNQKNFSNHYTTCLTIENKDLNIITLKVREVLKPNHYYNKYIANVLYVEDQNTSGKILLNVLKDSTLKCLKVDDVYKTKTNFQTLLAPLNPNQFDYKNYLNKHYVYHQLTTKKSHLLSTPSKHITVFGMADNIRQHINNKIKAYNFSTDELAIFNALLLGQRQNINSTLSKSYANAGVIHILAVSGLHVGIILWILNFILKPLERFKYGTFIKAILLVCIMWSFAIIAGLSASVTRAVSMFSIVSIAMHLKRPTNIYNTLAISVFIILLFKPLFLFDVGFQLSYLAVIAIVAINPFLHTLWKPKFWITNKLWHTFTVSISAQLGIIPLSLFYFHQFPGLFFISNLVIIPVLGIILMFGVLVILLSVLNILPQFMADFYGCIISLMNHFVDAISKQESFLIENISFGFLYLLAFYCLIITFVQLLLKQNYIKLQLFLTAIIIVQATFFYTKYNKTENTFIIFHKSKQTLLGKSTNNKIIVASDFDSVAKYKSKIITDYTIKNHIKTTEEQPIANIYQLNKTKLFIVDSLGIYNVKALKPDYVLLRQSPKINLSRLIDSLNPKQIIADGSNYKSYVKHWKAICRNRKLPFHHTGKKGAFTIHY